MGNRSLTSRAVFLDRDGVINEAVVRCGRPYPPASVESLRIIEDAPAALTRLSEAGFELIVVTNQPDVARGTQSRETVETMHAFLQAHMPIDAIYACFHDDAMGCPCRKPLPGLILQAAIDRSIDPTRSYLIGDRWRDIDAGWAAGVTPLLIDRVYMEQAPLRPPRASFASLKVAVSWILNRPEC